MREIQLKSIVRLMMMILALDSFAAGFEVKCYDDVSSAIYEVKVTDLALGEATVGIDASQEPNRFYPNEQVEVTRTDEGVRLVMKDRKGSFVEELLVYDALEYGVYVDLGDSRGVECF